MIGRDARTLPGVNSLLGGQSTISLKDRIYQIFHHQLNFHGAKDTAQIYILNDVSTIAELNQELTEKNQVLQDLNEKILNVTSFNRKVQSILSHDLTGSLSGVKFLLEGLKNKVDPSQDPQTAGFLKNAIEASGSSLNLLKDILAWSHDEESQQLISVEASLNNAIKQLAPQILEKEITIEKDLSGTDIQINVSRKMLEAVFRNLLSNAIKYSHRRGVVAINCTIEGTNLTMSFTDNGSGMSAEKVNLLMSQNYQHSELDGEFGLGLGLKFTFDFIRQMNGEITIQSEVGRGSKFILKLPV
jgi:signal transduction histidine kinase